MEQWFRGFVWIVLWRILDGLAVPFVWRLCFDVGQGSFGSDEGCFVNLGSFCNLPS